MFSSEVISSFNELESALYRYIMENSEKVVYMRIRDLADAAHISTSSVLRFCRKVNCEGFSEFKVKLKMYLEAEQTPSLKSTQHFLYEFIERTLKGDFEEKIKEQERSSLRVQRMCCLLGRAVLVFWRSMGQGTFRVLRNFHSTSTIRFSR